MHYKGLSVTSVNLTNIDRTQKFARNIYNILPNNMIDSLYYIIHMHAAMDD